MTSDEIEGKNRSTITVDSVMGEKVVSRLDEDNYMQLGKSCCTRADLFLYAMALGWTSKLPTPIEKPLSGGFARTESFSPKLDALIDLLHFGESEYQDPDTLRNKNSAYSLAEQYANGGFHLIQSDLQRNVGSEEQANLIIAELDQKYADLFPSDAVTYSYVS